MYKAILGSLQGVATAVKRLTLTTSMTRTILNVSRVRANNNRGVRRLVACTDVDGAGRSQTLTSPTSGIVKKYLTEAKLQRPISLSALTPLRGLGGLSLAAYMALEATEGHLALWQTWRTDLAKDLVDALRRAEVTYTELVEAKDRIEDLEMMVNDLTVFIELKKEEITRLKRGIVAEVD
jgi:hypothetical protein